MHDNAYPEGVGTEVLRSGHSTQAVPVIFAEVRRILRELVAIPAGPRPGAAEILACLQTFREFPPRQKPGSFSVGEAMEMLMKGTGSK